MVDAYIIKQTGAGFNVIEHATQNLIESDVKQPIAAALSRKLNKGGGFGGWTPSFFLERILLSEDSIAV